ncbi:MAG: hypothetical protein V7K47_29130 [Nostoc sp.]
MQLIYLPLACLNNIKQSILKKQLIIKPKTPLLQMLGSIKTAIAPLRSSCPTFFRIVSQVERNSCQA